VIGSSNQIGEDMERGHLLKGAEREAVASADLMHKGFEVFRAMGNYDGEKCLN
jgi:hypothetical protein